MRTIGIFFIVLLFVGILTAAPLQKSIGVGMRMEPAGLLYQAFPKEHITLFDDYGMKPIPPQIPQSLLQGQGTYDPNLEEEYY